MSCLDKLKNAPGLSSIDKLTKQMVPSIIGILPTPQKIAIAAKNVAALTKNIAEQVATEINNTINAVTGKISATANAVKGIGTALKSIEQKFVNSVKKVAQTLNQQAKAVSDFLDCEINAMKENSTADFEASELQTGVTAAATAAGGALTNNQIKEFAENPAKKAEFIAAKTEEVKAKTVQNVATTPSNKQVYDKQKESVKKLEATSPPPEAEDFIYTIPRSVLTSTDRRLQLNGLTQSNAQIWTRAARLQWMTGNPLVRFRLRALEARGEMGKKGIEIIQEEIQFLRDSKEIYPKWPWERKVIHDLYGTNDELSRIVDDKFLNNP